MKRIIVMAILALAIFAWGDSYWETRTWTTSFVFLGGDSTASADTLTDYVELNLPAGKYRFNKLQYQADVSFGGMSNCSAWVQLQQGPGSTDAPYDTLKSFVITQDSLYSTSGWNLTYTWLADSAKPDIRVKVKVITINADTGASAGEKVDSAYTINHTIHAWGRD